MFSTRSFVGRKSSSRKPSFGVISKATDLPWACKKACKHFVHSRKHSIRFDMLVLQQRLLQSKWRGCKAQRRGFWLLGMRMSQDRLSGQRAPYEIAQWKRGANILIRRSLHQVLKINLLPRPEPRWLAV